MAMQPQIILLKEGTDSSQGKGQLLSNIGACVAVADAIRTTLGPRGMDKLIVDNRGKIGEEWIVREWWIGDEWMDGWTGDGTLQVEREGKGVYQPA